MKKQNYWLSLKFNIAATHFTHELCESEALYLVVVLGIELTALWIPGKCSTTELRSQQIYVLESHGSFVITHSVERISLCRVAVWISLAHPHLC